MLIRRFWHCIRHPRAFADPWATAAQREDHPRGPQSPPAAAGGPDTKSAKIMIFVWFHEIRPPNVRNSLKCVRNVVLLKPFLGCWAQRLRNVIFRKINRTPFRIFYRLKKYWFIENFTDWNRKFQNFSIFEKFQLKSLFFDFSIFRNFRPTKNLKSRQTLEQDKIKMNQYFFNR